MEIDINLSENKIPAYVLAFVTLKVLFVAVMTIINGGQQSAGIDWDCFSCLSDNYLWIPMLVFFVYFYLYRRGKMSDTGLKYSLACVLISIVPKAALFAAMLIMKDKMKSWEMYLYVTELVVWALIYLFLLSFWYGKLKLKEHHHHHHSHHHSSAFED